MATKTVCSVSREEFNRCAPKSLVGNVGSVPVILKLKNFSTGSMGWYANGKMEVEINGKTVECQVGFNLTIVGSKEVPGHVIGETVAAAS